MKSVAASLERAAARASARGGVAAAAAFLDRAAQSMPDPGRRGSLPPGCGAGEEARSASSVPRSSYSTPSVLQPFGPAEGARSAELIRGRILSRPESAMC